MPRQVGPTHSVRMRLSWALGTLLCVGSACTTFGFDPGAVEVRADASGEDTGVQADGLDTPDDLVADDTTDASDATDVDTNVDTAPDLEDTTADAADTALDAVDTVDTVEPTDPVVALAAGDAHTCLLRQSGVVACWGANDVGQLGDGTTNPSTNPTTVPDLDTVTALTARAHSTCALRTDGQVLCWGANNHGQLGDGTTDDRHSPVPVINLTDARAIALGDNHGCAVHGAAGAVRCWGRNDKGQLGDDTTEDQPQGTDARGLTGAIDVAAGHKHTCASTAQGAWCWGQGGSGQLGDDDTNDRKVPVTVVGLVGPIDEVVAGDDSSCALDDTGALWCWGHDDRDQIGGGGDSDVAVQVTTGVTDVAAGGKHVCVRSADATVACWGDNADGQLGTGSTTQLAVPTPVADLTARDDGGLATGKHHTCAASPDGTTVHCWGRNDQHQLGILASEDQLLPVEVVGL